jgi:hypothetical protein
VAKASGTQTHTSATTSPPAARRGHVKALGLVLRFFIEHLQS